MSGVGSIGSGGYAALVQRMAAQKATQNAQSTSTAASNKAFEMPKLGGVNDPTANQSAAMAPLGAPTVPAGEGVDRVLATVKDAQASADKMVIDLASGRDVNIHNTMVELEKADIALKYTVQLRNRALSAYEELMRMQV